MSGVTSYASYIADLAASFCDEVSRSTPHKEAIDRFCTALEPFDLSPSIYVTSAGALRLTALSSGDSREQIRALLQAGYEIGAPVEDSVMFWGCKTWAAPVRGHGQEFELHITTKD